MNLSTSSFRLVMQFVLLVLLIGVLFFLNETLMRQIVLQNSTLIVSEVSPTEEQERMEQQMRADERERAEQRNGFLAEVEHRREQGLGVDLVFVGNSTMYLNLGDTNRFINEELSRLLNRDIYVQFASAPGVESDWVYFLLRDYIAPADIKVPVVWFFWTGMPFHRAEYTDVDTQAAAASVEERIFPELPPSEDFFRIEPFLRKKVYIFRTGKQFRKDARQFLLNGTYSLVRKYFDDNEANARDVLTRLFRNIESDNRFALLEDLGYWQNFPKIQEKITHFDETIPFSYFPRIESVVRENDIDLNFLEVTTRNIVEREYRRPVEFHPKDFSYEKFFEYRNLQNAYLRQQGFPVLSLIDAEGIDPEMFADNFHLVADETNYRSFAKLVAGKLVKAGMIR